MYVCMAGVPHEGPRALPDGVCGAERRPQLGRALLVGHRRLLGSAFRQRGLRREMHTHTYITVTVPRNANRTGSGSATQPAVSAEQRGRARHGGDGASLAHSAGGGLQHVPPGRPRLLPRTQQQLRGQDATVCWHAIHTHIHAPAPALQCYVNCQCLLVGACVFSM